MNIRPDPECGFRTWITHQGSMFRAAFGRTLRRSTKLYGPTVLRQTLLCRPICTPWPHGARIPKVLQTCMNNPPPALSIIHHVRLFSAPATRDTKRGEDSRNETDPQFVSTTSTATPILGSSSKTTKPARETDDVDMLAGLVSDLVS